MTDANGDNELIYKMEIEGLEDIQKTFDQLDKEIDKLAETTSQGFEKVDDTVKNTGKEIGILGGVVAAITQRLIEFALNGVTKFYEFGKASIDLRARVDTLGVSLQTVGQNAGYTTEQLDKYEEAVKQKGITTQEARSSLIQMAQAEIDLSKASDLARVAQDAAVNAGIKSSDALNRIVHAITTQQSEILRNLNLTVDFQAEYAKYATQTNRTVEQLSRAEKVQIAMNATLKAGAVIAGTYENAMGSVGKQLTSLPRYVEELQYELGGMFQPAYLEMVESYKDLLSQLLVVLKDNKEEIQDAAEIFGDFANVIVKGLMAISEWLGILKSDPDKGFVGFINDIDQLYGHAQEFKSIFDVLSTGMDTFRQSTVLAAATLGGITAAFEQLIQPAKAVLDIIIALANRTPENMEKARAAVEWMTDPERARGADALGKAFQEGYIQTFQEALELFPALKSEIEGTADANKKLGDSSKYAEIMAQKQEEALSLLSARLTQLRKKLDEEAAELAIKKQRQEIEEELRQQWATEDRERNHQERLKQINENAGEQKSEYLEQFNENKLKMEEDYRKRLQDLLRSFDEESEELLRRRDAVGLMALQRRYKRQLESEKKAQEERKQEVEKNYTKTLEKMEESLQKQLKKAEEARVKELENVQRQLDRQRVIKDLHNKWEEEDRQRSIDKQLRQLIDEFAVMKGVTRDGLNSLLNEWGMYYSSLGKIIGDFYAKNAAMQSGLGIGGVSLGTQPGYPRGRYSPANPSQQDPSTQLGSGEGVIGQAGMVSNMLPSKTKLSPSDVGNVSRVPAVSPSKSSQEKRIRVTVDGNYMDPYIQRLVANTLFEIERNRG